ncbi:MAG TPA: hypothetical protein PLG66_16135, partial [Calditrichia bacterium]|nr:hypothetical protein [Calditrichia bacterium]
MNRLIWVSILLLAVGTSVFAQNRSVPYYEFKFGGFTPQDADFGNILGISFGRKLDDRLYMAGEFNY